MFIDANARRNAPSVRRALFIEPNVYRSERARGTARRQEDSMSLFICKEFKKVLGFISNIELL
jgi:hypothetical protein